MSLDRVGFFTNPIQGNKNIIKNVALILYGLSYVSSKSTFNVNTITMPLHF